ncbi:M18 family aminopeptidase [Selenomonas sp.]|uniref:M18 family aminopeptidase n=1 Tax=Selenomonas sp. TaxID=2053611 RepID=UPI003FA3239B
MTKTNTTATELIDFITCAASPFHVVKKSAERLEHAGFQELHPADAWRLFPGGRYFVKVYGSTLFAFTLGEKSLAGCRAPLRMAAAHTDFPCFRLKPAAGIASDGYGSLNVEPYGGLILRTWLDRPLSLAGKVMLRGSDAFHPEEKLVDFPKPLMTIPSLAIHMDREVNKSGALNAQKDMLPLAALVGAEAAKSDFFLPWLAASCGVEPTAILSYDLSAYPCETGCTFGMDDAFISSPRLDNLTSVLACLKGIEETRPDEGLRLIALFDNEEVGSRTKQGAGSTVLSDVLRRIYQERTDESDALIRALADGFLLSVDVAHAVHPSHAAKSDPNVRPTLGAGVVLKQAASQSYAGDAEAVAIVRALAEEHAIPWQRFVNRADSRGGSTLGAIASSFVPVRTMDIGAPLLAMHSARETMGCADQDALERLLKVFLA